MTEAQRKIAEQQSLSGINKMWNALTPLRHMGNFMNCGAHPDDERSHILALLARKDGVRISYATATRGKGGQNAIGGQAGDDLGVFRTEELQSAAEQIPMSVYFFSDQFGDPIDDFGFSTDPSEAEQHWGADRLRERLVRIIRRERPDVISPTFLDVDGQHGHHRAVTRATLDAYDLAADPKAYPDQISKDGLKPWQVKKLYLSASSGRGGVYDDSEAPPEPTIALNTGEWDEMAGATYRQIGEWSRARHLTQGMGRWRDAKPENSHLHRLRCQFDIPLMEDDIFFGLIKNYDDMAAMTSGSMADNLIEAGRLTKSATAAFPDRAKIFNHLNDLALILSQIDDAMKDQDDDIIFEFAHRIKLKRKQLAIAIIEASGLKAEIIWDHDYVSPGQDLTGRLSLYNISDQTWDGLILYLVGETVDSYKKIDLSDFDIKSGQQKDITVKLEISADAAYHHPLNMDYEPMWKAERFSATFGIPTKGRAAIMTLLPDNPVLIVPPLNLSWEASGLFYNRLCDGDPIEAMLSVDKFTQLDGDIEVGLDAPAGWQVIPPFYTVKKGQLEESAKFNFIITGPTGNDRLSLTPYAQSQGKRMEENVLVMDYPHIRNTCKIVANALAVQPVDLEIPARLKVGYVSRGADRVNFWLSRFGVDVTILSINDLKTADLSIYDTIMIGIRAFRADLTATSSFLRHYVENGGNLVTQYNRTDDNWNDDTTPPRPITIGSPSFRWRITDPDAEVTHLIADHHLLNAPNKIDVDDWKNWHQERGLYFVAKSDDIYEELLSMADHGKKPLTGGLISAKIGDGWHHHCSLILHHQLEHQVPGAARLLANLITPQDWK